MYAPQHTVFIGPGKLPDELRQVLAKRAGAPQPDIAIQVPRLLALFESAAEAERVASQVQRLKLGAAVAGPEQPPAELSWTLATGLGLFDLTWRVTTSTGEELALRLTDITAVTLLDWRPDEGAADRAALLTLRDQKPLMVRASALDTVSRHSVPIEGIRALNELLDAAARVLPPETRVRSRRLAEADFRGEGKVLTGDLLPLVLAVVDAVDTLPGVLPQPLQGRATPPPNVRPAHQSATAALASWGLYALSLPAMVLALAFLTMGSVTFGVGLGVAGLAVGGWATRRFMWSRWLARANWGADAPVPSWPIADDERGIAPRGLELGLDVLALGAVAFTTLGDGLPHHLALWSLPFLGLGALLSAVAVYEAWQRE